MGYKEILDQYVSIANTKSVGNTEMNTYMFLSAVGALIHKKGMIIKHTSTLDMRIHPLIIQPSRTGKGEALKVLEDFMNGLQGTIVKQLQFTDAGIVGSIDEKAAETNRKYGYVRGDPDYNEEVIIGDLGLYDIIAFSEAKQMFKSGAYSEDIFEIFQTSMDSPGYARKKLSKGVLSYPVDATILGTTYMLDEFNEIIHKQGIFQRMLVMVKDFTFEERLEQLIKLARVKTSDTLPEKEYKRRMDALTDDVISVLNEFPDDTVIEISEKGEDVLAEIIRQKGKWIEKNFFGDELEIMAVYLSAFFNMYRKLAGISAVLNGKSKIGVKEILDVKEPLNLYFTGVVNGILLKVSNPNDQGIRKVILSKVGASPKGIDIDSIVNDISMTFGVGDRRVRSIISKLAENKQVKRDGKILRKR